eukprot:gene4193-3031_t
MAQNLSYINPGGKQAMKDTALQINMMAARGLQEVLKSGLGPRGTMKMLVSGAGQIKITKDGNTLLGEMQIVHPTASLIARTATATDDVTGDGSTSTVLVIGELMRQCELYVQEGAHPRTISEGFRLAREEAIKFLDNNTIPIPPTELTEYLTRVARTSLCTKVASSLVDKLSESVVQAVTAIASEGKEIDLHMVEVMHMRHRLATDTRFVNGIVLDHGARNGDMPKCLENAYIFICNVSLEYEKSELATGFYYKDPEEKARMVQAERKMTDDRVRQIIALKKQVCTKENGRTFVVINQKGIDPIALEMLAKENIIALRRAKRRNMERLVLACGGEAVNSTENLTPEVLGTAGLVQQYTIGDENYTFVEDVKQGQSCSLIVKGPNDHTIAQIKDAIRDGLRAVKNAYECRAVLAGAGAFEVALYQHLLEFEKTVVDKRKYGVHAYAEAILVLPKTLAENYGLDVQESILALRKASDDARKDGKWVGLDLSGNNFDVLTLNPVDAGVLDNVIVKRSILEATAEIAAQILLVDEIMKAGRRGAGGQ